MLKKLLVLAVVVLFAASPASAWFLDFEWGEGHDQEAISSGIPGLDFTITGGYDWVYGDITTGNWQTHSVDLGEEYLGGYYNMYGHVFAFLGTSANAGRISFLNGDGSWFQTLYCSAGDFYLEAYDINDVMIDSDWGPANRRYLEGGTDMGTLYVESASDDIAYVIMHDTGNYWCADNMSGDASGVIPPDIPEPGTLLLLGSGLLGLGAFLRRK